MNLDEWVTAWLPSATDLRINERAWQKLKDTIISETEKLLETETGNLTALLQQVKIVVQYLNKKIG